MSDLLDGYGIDAEALRACVRAIADDIVGRAIREDGAAHWITAGYERSRMLVWSRSSNLYGGGAGIALFLLEASAVLDDGRYRELAFEALSGCRSEMLASPLYAFYSGRTGLAYSYLRAAELTGDQSHVETAIALCRGAEEYAATAPVNDLLHGSAGAIAGLLHLLVRTGQEWIADAIDLLARRVIAEARWSDKGISWDVGTRNVRGLCGLSHGAAGVAMTLLEADKHLGRPAYRQVAIEAIRYEDAWFDHTAGTWPDFRKLKYLPPEEFEAEYRDKDDDYFSVPSFMDVWCHGAPGIALSRIRAAELLGDAWRKDVDVALQRTAAVLESRWSSFTLCHGAGGVASTLLEAALALNDRRFLPKVGHVARAILDTHDRKERFISGYSQLGRTEDPTLLMGNAGIGYFLLQLVGDVPNILSPAIRRDGARSDRSLDEGPLHETLARGLMPQTTDSVKDAGVAARTFYATWHSRDDVLGFLREGAIQAGLGDTYDRERAKLDLLDHCPSFALPIIAEWRQKTAGVRRSVGDPADGRFQLAPWVRLLPGQGLLIRVKETLVSEIALNPLAERVFDAVGQSRDLESIVALLASDLDAAAEDIREAVVHQLQSALDAGLIVMRPEG